jgi:energy-coupling factor transporter ATP-binding protein EcfA2
MTAAAPLVVENVSFRYRDRAVPAIREVSFSAKAGEVLLVAGASGCGKTTLIRVINGLAPRSYKGELTGRVLFDGADTAEWKLAEISQHAGTVLQDPERQILGTKVLNEVAFGLENLALGREEIRGRVDEALQLLRIAELGDRDTFSLSGGEKQKVALAGVLAMRPRILLLDEPLASLDPASAIESLQIVRKLADDGMAVIIVEHRVEDVMRIHPERTLYLGEGAVRYLGSLDGLASAVDYREIKLPADDIVDRARKHAAPNVLLTHSEPPAVANGREELVRFENVSFAYEAGEDVLLDVSLGIREGDVIAVLGANGAGKTTLVKHAIGLLKPSAGRVRVAGRDTRNSSVAQIASTLGYVFQSPSHMLFARTVHEELAFGPTNLAHPGPQIEKEVNEALSIVDLQEFAHDPPLALSFGQQKRVSIAAILAMRSRILVMDEPTAGQDYQHYMTFMDSIIDMPGFNAVMFITHDVDLAVIYANRVLLVAGGRLIADGPPEEVLPDFERLEACRLVPSSLLTMNVRLLPETGSFMRAEALAHL